jgi:hypothetical protein
VKFAFISDLDEEEQRKPRKERIPVSLMCEYWTCRAVVSTHG